MQKEAVPRCPKTNFAVDRSVGRDLWTEFGAVIPAHHTFEDVCHPRYFGQFRTSRPESPRSSDNGLRVRDRIHLCAADGSWIATLLVRDMRAGIDEVHTKVLSHMSFAAGELPEGYEIRHLGPRGHAIFLHGSEVEAGFADPEQAGNRINYLTREKAVEARIESIQRAEKAKPKTKKEPVAETPVPAPTTAG